MATINHFGPYHFQINSGLPPGKAKNVKWGPSDVFSASTINVTGHPGAYKRGEFALWVSDMSIEHVVTGSGDLNFVDINAYATFGNDGRDTIDYITAFLTVTTA